MKLELACGENTHAAEVEEDGGGYRVRIGEGPWHRYELHQLGAGMRALLGEGRPVIFSAVPQPGGYRLSLGGAAWDVLVGRPGSRRRADLVDGSEGAREVRAQMPGLVLRVVAAEGQQVARGEALLVLEAMKMANELQAVAAGRITAVHCREGQRVERGELLLVIEPDAAA